MGLFNKVVKHSKSSKELDKKIKNFNEEFEKNKLISSKKMFSDEEIDEILSKNIELEYNEFDLNESGLSEIDKSIEDLSEKYKKNIIEKKSALDGKSKEIKKIFNELYKNEVENVVENYISKYSKDIVNLREDLFYEVQKKPTVNLNVLEDKINLLTIRYNQLSEGLLDGSYNNNLKNPINIEQLKNHYQLLVGRLQEQLATIGGGGEVNLKYLDDVVGIATNPSVYDGKYLKYDHSIGKFVFEDVSGISTFSGDYNDLTNKPTIPSIVGLASEGYVDNAVSGVSTFSGDYNDLTNKPTIPSVVGLASEGYVDNAVSGVSTFSGDYNDLTNKPTIPSIVGLASEGYVDNAVGGITTFTGAATTITSNQISNWDTSYGWGDHGVVGYATEAVTNSLQSQINSLGTNLNIIGFYDATIGVVTSLTVVGETREYISVGNTLPSVGITTGDYLIISTGGNDVGIASYISLGITSAYPGDWIVGVGNSEWNILSYSQQVIAPRATNADFADTLKSDSSVNTSGIITAGSFYGNGANLSGVVTSLVGYATEGYVDNAVVGFVTSGSLVGYLTTEADTLATVTGRGATTANSIDVGELTISGGTNTGTIDIRNNTNSSSAIYFNDASGTVNANIQGVSGYLTLNSAAGANVSVNSYSVFSQNGDVTLNSGGNGNTTVGGTLTAGSFYGNGANLSGVVTSLVGYATEGYVDNAVVGFITSGASGSELTGLTGASEGTYGGSTNSAQISVDANGRITGISQVAISGGGGGGISGINIYDSQGALGVTTNIKFVDNLDAVSVGNTIEINVTGVVTSLVGYATEGYVDNAIVGFVTSGSLVGYLTTETDTLATVTARGNSTSSGLSVSGVSTFQSHVEVNGLNVSGISTFGTSYEVTSGSGTFTASAGVSTNIESFNASDYKVVEYKLWAQHANGIQSQKVIVMHDDNDVYTQESDIFFSNTLLVGAGATISGGTVSLTITPESGVNGITTYRYSKESLV